MKNRVKNLKIDHLRKVTNRFLDKKEPFSKDKTTGQNADLVLLLKNVKGFFTAGMMYEHQHFFSTCISFSK